MSSAAERLAALKARVAAAVSGGPAGAKGSAPGGGNGGRPPSGRGHSGAGAGAGGSPSGSDLASTRTSGLPPSGGLNVPLHPALENLGSTTYSKTASRAVGGRGGPRDSRGRKAVANPYLDDSNVPVASSLPDDAAAAAAVAATGAAATPAAGGAAVPRPRQARQLVFNQKGKYIQQGNALRRQAALEAMKKRIAEQARKAGMDEIPSDKNFVVEAPPDVEWVDQGYFAEGKTYEDLDAPGCLAIHGGGDGDGGDAQGEHGIITDLVQHPVPIEPPQDKLVPAPKAEYLTKKEQKKMRRARRMAELKENQAKIRLGLMPAPPPKVKRSNLMRVLGEEAVQDPTAVEARVNREIAGRFEKHMEANEERKLTKEERHAKLAANQAKDAAKGIHMLIFKIPSLANGQHRFKIWKNADQLALTGVCVMHPKACLVVVEGGEHSINKYRKLMMQRIDWTQNIPTAPAPAPAPALALSGMGVRSGSGGDDAAGSKGPARPWLASESETLPDNRIQLLFDGETKGRAFRKWSSKICDTDRDAYDFLERTKLESFWTQARSSP